MEITDPAGAAREDAKAALHLPGAVKSWARHPVRLPRDDASRRDWLRQYAAELAAHADGVQRSETWKLEGYDTFSNEPYALGRPGSGLEPSYPSRDAALAGAHQRLADLERSQPSASSGGQDGIQDRVYLIHPDGHRERVLP
jgi:hypothetical protein